MSKKHGQRVKQIFDNALDEVQSELNQDKSNKEYKPEVEASEQKEELGMSKEIDLESLQSVIGGEIPEQQIGETQGLSDEQLKDLGIGDIGEDKEVNFKENTIPEQSGTGFTDDEEAAIREALNTKAWKYTKEESAERGSKTKRIEKPDEELTAIEKEAKRRFEAKEEAKNEEIETVGKATEYLDKTKQGKFIKKLWVYMHEHSELVGYIVDSAPKARIAKVSKPKDGKSMDANGVEKKGLRISERQNTISFVPKMSGVGKIVGWIANVPVNATVAIQNISGATEESIAKILSETKPEMKTMTVCGEKMHVTFLTLFGQLGCKESAKTWAETTYKVKSKDNFKTIVSSRPGVVVVNESKKSVKDKKTGSEKTVTTYKFGLDSAEGRKSIYTPLNYLALSRVEELPLTFENFVGTDSGLGYAPGVKPKDGAKFYELQANLENLSQDAMTKSFVMPDKDGKPYSPIFEAKSEEEFNNALKNLVMEDSLERTAEGSLKTYTGSEIKLPKRVKTASGTYKLVKQTLSEKAQVVKADKDGKEVTIINPYNIETDESWKRFVAATDNRLDFSQIQQEVKESRTKSKSTVTSKDKAIISALKVINQEQNLGMDFLE